jgi:predicted small secreted protein
MRERPTMQSTRSHKLTRLRLAFGLGLMLALLLTGCHTLKGLGRDFEQGGEALQQATDSDEDKPQREQVISPI